MQNNSLVTVGRGNLTVQKIEDLIVDHRSTVTSRAMVKLVREYDLIEQDVDTILAVTAEFSASLAKVRKLLEKGLKCREIQELYGAREMIASHDDGLPFTKILLLKETFVEGDFDAALLCHMAEQIHEAANAARAEISMEHAIMMACSIAKKWNINTVHAICEFLEYRAADPKD